MKESRWVPLGNTRMLFTEQSEVRLKCERQLGSCLLLQGVPTLTWSSPPPPFPNWLMSKPAQNLPAAPAAAQNEYVQGGAQGEREPASWALAAAEQNPRSGELCAPAPLAPVTTMARTSLRRCASRRWSNRSRRTAGRGRQGAGRGRCHVSSMPALHLATRGALCRSRTIGVQSVHWRVDQGDDGHRAVRNGQLGVRLDRRHGGNALGRKCRSWPRLQAEKLAIGEVQRTG